jgi:hypothetical protein
MDGSNIATRRVYDTHTTTKHIQTDTQTDTHTHTQNHEAHIHTVGPPDVRRDGLGLGLQRRRRERADNSANGRH